MLIILDREKKEKCFIQIIKCLIKNHQFLLNDIFWRAFIGKLGYFKILPCSTSIDNSY